MDTNDLIEMKRGMTTRQHVAAIRKLRKNGQVSSVIPLPEMEHTNCDANDCAACSKSKEGGIA